MGRIITSERRDQIAAARAADPDALGPILAELAIDGNVPIEAISKLLSVSKPTVYRWMYGQTAPLAQPDKILKLERLITTLRKAKRARDLPLQGTITGRTTATYALVLKHKPQPRSGSIPV